MTKKFLTAALLGASMLAAAPASAAIFLEIGFNGGARTAVAADVNGVLQYNGSLGGYDFRIGAEGTPSIAQPDLLTQSISIARAAGASGTVNVFLTQTGLGAFTGDLVSSFANTSLTAGSSATITSYISPTNTPFAGSVLQTTTFTTTPSMFTGSNSTTQAGPFSTTVQYDLNLVGTGARFNGTADIDGTAAVPEPATWALMMLGFGLVGSSLRNRRRAMVSA